MPGGMHISLHLSRTIRFILIAACGGLLFGQAISFLAPVNTSVGGGLPASGPAMAVADFNGDGKPDIVVETPSSGDVVLYGNGDGTFRPGQLLPTGTPWVGDIHGDGRPDLVIAGSYVSIELNKGDGTFAAPIISVAECTGLAAVADFNGDRKADLICGTTVLLGNGDGTFKTGVTVDAGLMERVLLAADFNNDGRTDLLMEQASGQLAVALGKGDGTFGADLVATTLPNLFSSVVVGDFNGDGKLDLAGSGTSAGLICVAPGNGDGTFGTVAINQGIPGAPSAAGDFNGDGKLDLVAGGMVLAGNGDGTFRVPTFIPVTGASPAVADFNGDGAPDVAYGILGSSSGAISVLLNDSPGDGFLTAGVSSATLSWPIGPDSIASAFGTNLAAQTASAPANSYPTTLGGIRVHVRDSTGDNLAPLLYVSPTQINYVMTSSDAFAFVGIERVGSAYVPKGIGVATADYGEGFYSVGTGLAAASALSVAANYTETVVPVISCGSANCSLVPINVSGNPVYLSLYGTGFPQGTPTSSVTCTVAGQVVPVTYAGPQMQIPGLDQVNMLLPKTLAGAGTVSVACFFGSEGVNGYPANVLRVTIQ